MIWIIGFNSVIFSYILNRGWIDRESRHLPTYSEVTGRASGSIAPAKPSKKAELDPYAPGPSGSATREVAEDGAEVPDIDDLEEFDDVADVFESTYNFRFEEPYVHLYNSYTGYLLMFLAEAQPSFKGIHAR